MANTHSKKRKTTSKKAITLLKKYASYICCVLFVIMPYILTEISSVFEDIVIRTIIGIIAICCSCISYIFIDIKKLKGPRSRKKKEISKEVLYVYLSLYSLSLIMTTCGSSHIVRVIFSGIILISNLIFLIKLLI